MAFYMIELQRGEKHSAGGETATGAERIVNVKLWD